MTKIIKNHPLFLDRWASIYVEYYLVQGELVAKAWAERVLPEDIVPLVRPIAEQKFVELGYTTF